MPLTEQAQHALMLLTRRADNTCDLFILDRVDRAKDEIIRLNSSSLAPFQVRSAMAHAGAVLQERRKLVPSMRLSELEPQEEPGVEEMSFATVDTCYWLQTTPSLTESQRALLLEMAAGLEPDALAARRGISLPRVREQISRARKLARTAYASEVAAA
ncbi:hypothetical protein [Kitasatospora sp. NPDC057198]|uniref:hypothetical protein n=1 Tax=Kitasatospora sp. NPDC057198 TaxID=3346046 RepID=UPI003625F54F